MANLEDLKRYDDNYYHRSDFAGRGNIKWNRKDIARLSSAISNFNKNIDKLRTAENEAFMPSKLDYKTAKNEIFTRSELNRMINSLNRFKKENAGDLYTTQAGETLTKWERDELGLQSRIMQQRITKRIKEYTAEHGLSVNQMGDERLDALKSQLENLKQIESKKGADFNRLRMRLSEQGRSDIDYYRALIYRKNYETMLEGYQNFKHFKEFKAKLDSIKNPIKFYEFLDQNELASDIKYMYDIGGVGVSKMSDEDKFNNILLDLNIISEI